MTLLLKVMGIAMLTLVGATLIKPYRPEYAALITVAGSGVALFITVNEVESYFSALSGIFADGGLNPQYFSVALKAVGIGYLTEFAADAALDSGQTSLSSRIAFAGRTAILILALPIINELLSLALRLVNQ